MMIRFKGKSLETHRIKKKPIKEGFKFFVLSTMNGFILNFTPDGRTAAKKNEQEYTEQRGTGKIESMVLYLIGIIERFKKRKKKECVSIAGHLVIKTTIYFKMNQWIIFVSQWTITSPYQT